MENKVEKLHNAVIIAFNYDNPRKRLEAENYILNIAENNPKQVIDLFIVAEREEVKFWCLQACELRVKKCWSTTPEEIKHFLRGTVMDFYNNVAIRMEQSLPVKNKLASIIVGLVREEYPSPWNSFFRDLCTTLQQGMGALDLFFRILVIIDEDIITLAKKSSDELDQSVATRVKDAMRISDINVLADLWYEILNQTHEEHPEYARRCLEIIDLYINWIPLECVVNENFISLFFRFLNNEKLQNETVDCLYEILKKRMSHEKKIQLIRTLGIIKVIENVKGYDKSNLFAKSMAGLIEGIMSELIIVHEEIPVVDLIQDTMEISFNYLKHSDPEVVSEILEVFVYVWKTLKGHTKKHNSLDSTQLRWFQLTFAVVTQRIPYPVDYDPSIVEEENEMLIKFRTTLDTVFHLLVRVDPEQVKNMTLLFLMELLQNFESLSWNQVEGGLHILDTLGKNVNRSPDWLECEQFSQILTGLFELPDDYPVFCHPEVCLEYFNVVHRFGVFFETHPQFLSTVLASFANHRGIQHSNPTVRSRAAYKMNQWLMSISIKTRVKLRPFLKELLQILVRAVEVFSSCPTSEHRASHGSLARNDMKYVCETIGILCQPTLVGNDAEALLREALNPVISTIQNLASGNVNEMDRVSTVARLSDLFRALAAATKSFGWKMDIIKPWLKDITSLCLQVYELFKHEDDLRTQFIFLIHQATRVLHKDKDLVSLIPKIWELLLSSVTSENYQSTYRLITKMISQIKFPEMKTVVDQSLGYILQGFESLLAEYNNIDTSLGSAVSHKISERKAIIEEYYRLLSNIVRYDFSICLLSNRNQHFFETILHTLLNGCDKSDLSDYFGIKQCLNVFFQLICSWGNHINEVQILLNILTNQFTIKLFSIPLHPDFNFEDAQANDCLKLICKCQCSLFKAIGNDYLEIIGVFLIDHFNLTRQAAQEYCHILSNGKAVTLKQVLNEISRIRSSQMN